MRIFSQEIFPRTNLRLLKDAFVRLGEIFVLFCRGRPQEAFQFVDQSAIRRIIDYYGGHTGHLVDKKKGNLGYGFLHYGLIRTLGPQRVLCVGSARGFIPAVCALACKDNQEGHVDFVDAGFERGSGKAWGGDGFWKRVDPQKHFALLGLKDWIDTYVMTTKEFALNYPRRQYGYIYLDGDHSYEGIKLDYELFWPKLKKGGLMAFHDVTVKEWGLLKDFGVWKFWQELKEVPKITFPLKQSGLGILQKLNFS